MTILNAAVAHDRALIVTDTSQSGGPSPEITGKCLAMPHLGLVTAAAGSGALWLEWVHLLLAGLPAGSSCPTIMTVGPEFLSDRWARIPGRPPSTILLAGATPDDRLEVALLHSRHDFEPRVLPAGVWLMPSLLPLPPAPDPQAPIDRTAVVDLEVPSTPPPWPHDWPTTHRMVLNAVKIQRTEGQVQSGGTLEQCLVTRDEVKFTRHSELEFLAALEASAAA